MEGQRVRATRTVGRSAQVSNPNYDPSDPYGDGGYGGYGGYPHHGGAN